MEKAQKMRKRILSKKLLVVPLCLILLMVTIVREEERVDSPQPLFEDGIYYDPLIPEIMVSPLNYSTSVGALSSSYPINVEGLRDEAGDGIITRYVLMALDDNFLSHSYETPKGVVSAWEYARHRIGRAFVWFYVLYNIRLQICGEVTWQSDSSTDEGMFYEVIEETGFKKGNYYNGYCADVLIAWTTEFRYFGGLGSQEFGTAMINYQGYQWDDNIAQHELSHVFNATDGTWEAYVNGINPCYYEECIMSYKVEWIDTWFEDGETYEVYTEIPKAYLTHIYCDSCTRTIDKWLLYHYWFLWEREWCCGGIDC